MNEKSKQYTFEALYDTFKFGEYKTLSLEEVLILHPDYLNWCISNISDFQISQDVLDEIKCFFPNYIIPLSIKDHIIKEDKSNYDWVADLYESECQYNYLEQHYDRYQGSWAQDIEGYSDEDIDTIFDGDPNAYWNID